MKTKINLGVRIFLLKIIKKFDIIKKKLNEKVIFVCTATIQKTEQIKKIFNKTFLLSLF
jgi:hypothetical protein